ncbi:MAG TPA: PAS domain S-box protein [Geobacteraceae bacterium]|nr:PAS domain S-box protein [Geobacteraceae bacterium]
MTERIETFLTRSLYTEKSPIKKELVMISSYVDEILRLLAEEAKDLAISMLDATGHVMKWNKVSEEIKGFRAEEIIGKHFSCLYSEEDREAGKPGETLKKAEAEGRCEVEEWRYRKDGSRFRASVAITALRDKDGNPLGYLKLTRDITKRNLGEGDNERLASFPQLISNPIFELDADGRVTFCNGAMKEILKKAGCCDDVTPFLPKNMPEILQAVQQKKALQYMQEIELNGSTYEERIYLVPQFEAIRIYATDITARKQAEEGLRASTEKYRAIVEAFDGLIYICSRDYRIEYMNEKLINRTGKNAVGEFCYKILHDRDSVCPWCINERVFAGETVHWELQSPKDGRWYYVVNVPIHNSDGSMSKQSMIMDITERKVAEEERKTTIEFLSLVNACVGTQDLFSEAAAFFQKCSGCEAVGIRLRAGDDYPYVEIRGFPPEFIQVENEVCLRDQEGNIFRDNGGNPVIECMCGNVICGRFDPSKQFFTNNGSFWTNSTTELLSDFIEIDRQARMRNRCNGKGYESVALIPLRLGQERLGLIQLNDRRKGLFSPEAIDLWERLAGYLAVALAKCRSENALRQAEEDLRKSNDELEKRVAKRTEQLTEAVKTLEEEIEARKNTEEALRASEERFVLAVHGVNDGIWDYEFTAGKVYFSSRWKNMLGYEHFEIRNDIEEWKSRIHPEDCQKVMDTWSAYLEGLTPAFEVEHRLRHKDGSYRWILSRGACLRDSHGKPYRMAGSFTDVTERKKLEQQLLQAQKMESIGLLAGGVAHDFNNLLTAITGYGEMIRDNIADIDIIRESIGQVLKAAESAAELTRSLLAFSRKQVNNPKPVVIDSIISDTSKLIQRIIGEDIEFSTSSCPRKLTVMADAGQIGQVLMNLASNARDAMPEGGGLSISTKELLVKDGSEALYDLPAPGRYVLVSVADTGNGIDEDSMERLFEPFYSTKEFGKGTGLGLSIVYGIVKQHNGSVQVSSKPGAGATFSIYLPVRDGGAATEEPTACVPVAGGTETLLVAEDEEIVQVFLKKTLERAGYKTITAGDGEEALALFKEHGDISLVLSDVVMPKKNGKEIVEEMRSLRPGVKVIFISGYTSDIMGSKELPETDVDFLTKPFLKVDLLRKVRKLLDKG